MDIKGMVIPSGNDPYYIAFRMCRLERFAVHKVLKENDKQTQPALEYLFEVRGSKCPNCKHRLYKAVTGTCFEFEVFIPKENV